MQAESFFTLDITGVFGDGCGGRGWGPDAFESDEPFT
jgi:hypothetical protein